MTKYVVTGPTAFMDYQPGETFDADLDEDLEARAIDRGSITLAAKATKKKEEAEDG